MRSDRGGGTLTDTRAIPPELRSRLSELLGDDAAERLMERLMPVTWDEVAKDRDLVAVRSDVDTLRTDVDALRTDVDALRVDVRELRKDVDALRTDVDALQIDVRELRSELREFRSEVNHRFEVITLEFHAYVRERLDVQTRQLLTVLVGAVLVSGVANFLALGR